MRDRLIESMKKTVVGVENGHKVLAETIWLPRVFEAMADTLLANGVIVPPCKAGDKAYHLTSIDTLDELNVAEIFEGKVSTVSIEDKVWIYCRYDNGLNFWYTERDIGRNLFLTREEAEKALAERSEGDAE